MSIYDYKKLNCPVTDNYFLFPESICGHQPEVIITQVGSSVVARIYNRFKADQRSESFPVSLYL
jgi:hypothetical protein